MRPLPFVWLQGVGTAYVLAQLQRGRRRRPPLTGLRPATGPAPGVTVLIPARNEADRIEPCLRGVTADPAVSETIVIDDGSVDGTGRLARAFGARVLEPGEPPPGWDGKSWALHRGLQEAQGAVVICLDADTRPRPGLAAAIVQALADADLVSVGTRFICDGPGERWLHPALLMSLIYRFGPPDSAGPIPARRLMVNGQCLAARRVQLLAAGGFSAAAGHFADDAALARALAGQGWRVVFHHSDGLVAVDMHASAREVWREWGRTIALRDVSSPLGLLGDVSAVWLTLGLPPLRILSGRATRLDLALIALRGTLSVASAPSYERRGTPYWLSVLADPLAAVRITLSALRPAAGWRGRPMTSASD